jgi:primosomal protein N' (replication factor Y)|tara:strand:+ start:368 stop:2521 length:2154 start_codon:yes stop_codon:yes gene_type:complete
MKKISVLLAANIPGPYDYLVSDDLDIKFGFFVRVPFRNKELIGIIWDDSSENIEKSKLKEIIEYYPSFKLSETIIDFIKFFSRYNFTSLGKTLKLFIPQTYLIEDIKTLKKYKIDKKKIGNINITNARQSVLDLFEEPSNLFSSSEIIKTAKVSPSVIKKLIEEEVLISVDLVSQQSLIKVEHKKFNLNTDQSIAAKNIISSMGDKNFKRFLIDGVTGSGKTEVYFEAIEEALKRNKQSLILLPEISLTESLFERIKIRFGFEPSLWHSDLSKTKRRKIWQDVYYNNAKLVIGARSSLFLPFKDLGLIVVDEEHDNSYKQQEGIIYQARDMAISLGSFERVPVVMVSATPSLETVLNIKEGKYKNLPLPERIGKASLPDINFIDMRDEEYIKNQWISEKLKTEIQKTLGRKEQSLIFLNRRGYAPVTLCKSCGYRLECPKCDSYLVEHKYNPKLICHQCGFSIKPIDSCSECNSKDSLVACGPGIERITDEILKIFPEARIATLSSDNAKDTNIVLKDMRNGLVDILIGTQIISKGHHFPLLTCVGVIDADLGMANGDLRAAERTYQLLHQVSGRTGREKRPGKAFLQTYFPAHPVIKSLVSSQKENFQEAELKTRKINNLPPYGKLASIILSDTDSLRLIKFCKIMKAAIPFSKEIIVLGPVPAPITKVRGRVRYRFLLKTNKAVNLQKYIEFWINIIKKPSSIRLTVDIDPYYFL